MIRVDPDKFAQSVVASHTNLGISQQLKEYVAAYKLADDYNTDLIKRDKHDKAKSAKLDHEKNIQKLRSAGLI